MALGRFSYSRWDGTQKGFDLDADAILAEVTDDLLYHGDLNAALRRLLQSGFRTRDGERVQGMRELLEKLRRKRREEITEEVAAERRMRLDLLPPDLAGQVRELGEYEFTSSEARERFDELMDRLRQQLMQSYFNEMAGAMANVSPEQMQRMTDMFNALNRMLEQREAGEEIDPSFEQFMQQFGDFFPGHPQTLDELLEQMAQQMAAMQAMLNSMSPEQRAQLQALSNQLLDDIDLRWQ